MTKIVTLGEIMLRLSPEGNDRFIQSESLRIIPGGGEANVAVSLANYGHDAYFVSKLPKHEIGQIAVNGLRRYGVNTEFIARGGDRVGLYYAETGASMRPSKVIYDVHTAQLLRLTHLISISTRLWRVPNGSIGAVLLQLLATRLLNLPSWLVRLLSVTA